MYKYITSYISPQYCDAYDANMDYFCQDNHNICCAQAWNWETTQRTPHHQKQTQQLQQQQQQQSFFQQPQRYSYHWEDHNTEYTKVSTVLV